MLRTRITEMFDIQYPIMSAPMALHSGGTLAAAVSDAGGLGSFGGVHPFAPPDWVREQIALVRQRTGKPFAVGFIAAFIPMFEGHFRAALDERVPVIALSFGDPQPWLDQAKSAGARVMCQVQTLEDARRAVSGGADVLVVQGNEAGGHTGAMNLLPFLARAADDFPDVPLMAAGGIADGRALAAVLAAGADGAWAGTAFLATPEAIEIPDAYKRLIVDSDGQDTVATRVYDVASGMPWPEGIVHRVRRNRFVQEWDGRDDEIVARREELGRLYAEAKQRFDPEVVDVSMGQGAGAVNAVRPAAEVLRAICESAERLLRQRASILA